MEPKQVPAVLDGYVIAFVLESLHDHDICIYGDPEGLRSLGEAIIAIANLNQKQLPDDRCPDEDSFHQHYTTGLRIADRERKHLYQLTIGRVDEKASGRMRDVFPPKAQSRRQK